MNRCSIIEQASAVLTEKGYEIILSNIADSAQSISNLPVAVIEQLAIKNCKVEPQGFVTKTLSLLMLDKLQDPKTENFSSTFETMEGHLIDMCNRLLDNQSVVDVSIVKSTPEYAKYTTMNDMSLWAEIDIITIY